MSFGVRRVIVENDADGKSVVTGDAMLPGVSAGTNTHITGSELWSTDMMPVDNSAEAQADQKEGVVNRYHDYNFVANGQGTTFRITEFAAGHVRIKHRTESLDYDVILAGEIDLELDDGQTVHLKTGDSIVVRGAAHAWVNRGTQPALVMFVMIDAKPVLVDGRELNTLIPAQG